MPKVQRSLVVLSFIVFLAIFLRGYKLNDWSVFKADQSRDALFAMDAVEKGLGYLRTVGPKIEVVHIDGDETSRGDSLRLGPIYYYQQYFSVKFFNNLEPWALIFPDFLFSILSLVVLFYFLKIFFSNWVSLLLVALYASSFFINQYSRMAWNPNQLPFWTLLFLFSIYKAGFDKEGGKASRWFWVSVVSWAVASQLHTVAIFGLPIVGILFLSVYSPKVLSFKNLFVATLLVLAFYSPLVLGDFKNKGDNVKRFIAVLKKDRDNGGLLKSSKRVFVRFGEFSTFALTSFNDRELEGIEKVGSVLFFSSFVFFGLLFLLGVLFEKKQFSLVERNFLLKRIKKFNHPFVFLILIWVFVYLLLFLKISDMLYRTRYFLILSFAPFIFLAFWHKLFLGTKLEKFFNFLFFLLVVLFISTNLWANLYWYQSMEKGVLSEKTFFSRNELKLDYHRHLVTAGTMKRVLAYMDDFTGEGDKRICFYSSDSQYKNGFEYLYKLSGKGGKISSFNIKNPTVFSDCVFFAITYNKDDDRTKFLKSAEKSFSIEGEKQFGALIVFKLKSRAEMIINSDKAIPKAEAETKAESEMETGAEEAEEESPSGERIEYFKDIFK